MSEEILVLLLRRDELCTTELAMILEKFPGKTIKCARIDPQDYVEHAAICEQRNPAFVVLSERPIPSLAMENGVPHVIFTREEIQELLPLKPQFKPFVPRGEASAEHLGELIEKLPLGSGLPCRQGETWCDQCGNTMIRTSYGWQCAGCGNKQMQCL